MLGTLVVYLYIITTNIDSDIPYAYTERYEVDNWHTCTIFRDKLLLDNMQEVLEGKKEIYCNEERE